MRLGDSRDAAQTMASFEAKRLQHIIRPVGDSEIRNDPSSTSVSCRQTFPWEGKPLCNCNLCFNLFVAPWTAGWTADSWLGTFFSLLLLFELLHCCHRHHDHLRDPDCLSCLYPCREFSNERTRVERRETFRKLRLKENFSKAFEGYFQWIIRAGESIRSRLESR